MRSLLKALLVLIGTIIVTRLLVMAVAQRSEAGSEVSDEFRRLALLDGTEFASRAGGLRSGQVTVVLGGARVDLREATIDPAGARIVLENTLGGLILVVRDDWAVTVDHTLLGGGDTQVSVTPPTDLPVDAPRLDVRAITRLGGTVITTDPAARS